MPGETSTRAANTAPRRSGGRLAHRLALARWAGPALLLALYAAAAVRYHDRNFLSLRTFTNLLSDNARLGIIAAGMTLVIVSGGIDLSVGAVMGLSSIATAALIEHHAWPAPIAMAAAVALGAGVGAGSGAVIRSTGLRPFIVTLAAMFAARGLAFIVSLESIGIGQPLHGRIASWGIPLGGPAAISIGALAFLAVALAAGLVLARTPFGLTLRATGDNEEAARLAGLRVGRAKVLVYAISGACAGLAGVVLTLYQSSGSHLEGVGMELDAIAAVVIGGTLLTGGAGSVFGTVVGVLIIGLVLLCVTTYEGNLTSGLTKVLIGALLLAFATLQRALAGRPR